VPLWGYLDLLRHSGQYWHTNACYYHHRIAYKLEVGNEINVSVDGTNLTYTGRGLFLLPDEIGETVWFLTAVGTSNCGGGDSGGGNGVLHKKLTSPTVSLFGFNFCEATGR